VRKEALGLLEQQSRQGNIDLYYGDSTKISEQGYVPYGWQFNDEQIGIGSQKGKSLNFFGFIKRNNEFIGKLTEQNIKADFIIELLDAWIQPISARFRVKTTEC